MVSDLFVDVGDANTLDIGASAGKHMWFCSISQNEQSYKLLDNIYLYSYQAPWRRLIGAKASEPPEFGKLTAPTGAKVDDDTLAIWDDGFEWQCSVVSRANFISVDCGWWVVAFQVFVDWLFDETNSRVIANDNLRNMIWSNRKNTNHIL